MASDNHEAFESAGIVQREALHGFFSWLELENGSKVKISSTLLKVTVNFSLALIFKSRFLPKDMRHLEVDG